MVLPKLWDEPFRSVRVDLSEIRPHVINRLDRSLESADRLAGIIGDRPSQYAKSPVIWNAVFKTLGLSAVFIPLDVEEDHLANLVHALRRNEGLLGFSVTVPYKVKIISLLDDLDGKARQIGAVNTVVRTKEGRLVGYNTDGSGFIWSLTSPLMPGEEPLLPQLKGVDALIIGAGGAGRAVAFYLAEAVGNGRLHITNRTKETAIDLAQEVNRAYGNARAVEEQQISQVVPSVGLIVNCSTKGQSGIRKLPGGRLTSLEPYSALAPAQPASLGEDEPKNNSEFYRKWFVGSLRDIEQNNRISTETVGQMSPNAVAYDVVYSPLETTFLRHCRLVGNRVAGGKGMNIAQAFDALYNKICPSYLKEQGLENSETRNRIVRSMVDVW